MYHEEYTLMSNGSVAKLNLLKNNPLGYFLSSMLAGIFVGTGILLIYTLGGSLGGAPYTKVVMGASFAVALSLVIMAGAELFTGNNMIMFSGWLTKRFGFSSVLKVWGLSYIGNWVGSILLAVIFFYTGLADGPTGQMMAVAAAKKMAVPLLPLFLRGVLCNLLVCLAVWCNFKMKSESGKLIMIFWCIYVFISCGFEHSVANMTLLTISLLAPFDAAISMSGYFYNILVVSVGNIVAAVLFLAIPYFIISRKKEEI